MIEVEKLSACTEEEDFKESITLPRNAVFYYLMMGIMIKTYLTPHSILMKLLFTMVITLVGAQVYVSLVKRKLEITMKPLPKVLHKGEHIQLQLTVRNLSRLPIPYVYLYLKESYVLVPKEIRCLCFTLGPRASQTFRIPYEALRSGMDEIGIDQIVWMDYLELVRKAQKYQKLQAVIILPYIQSFKVQGSLKGSTSSNRGDELKERLLRTLEGEVSYELAPYEEGTSERLIHWKLVAQRDIYRVRERQQLIKNTKEYIVIMDPVFISESMDGRKKAYWIDQIITHYMSYLYELIQQGEKVRWFGYQEGRWEQRLLHKQADLYQIEVILCKSYFVPQLKKANRVPKITNSESVEKILLTSHLDDSLKGYIEQKTYLKVLWLQKENEEVWSNEDVQNHKKLPDRRFK